MLRVMDELISGPAFASELGGGASPQALQSVTLSSSMAAEGTAKTRLLRLPGPGVTIIESPSPVSCGMVTLLRLPACAHPCHHGNSCPLPLLLAILNLHGLMEPCWQRHAS
ncbi:unnamed protein product [Boreogadus saida]